MCLVYKQVCSSAADVFECFNNVDAIEIVALCCSGLRKSSRRLKPWTSSFTSCLQVLKHLWLTVVVCTFGHGLNCIVVSACLRRAWLSFSFLRFHFSSSSYCSSRQGWIVRACKAIKCTHQWCCLKNLMILALYTTSNCIKISQEVMKPMIC